MGVAAPRTTFSPKDFSVNELAVATLVNRMMSLDKEALGDLVSLGKELAKCGDEDTYREIVETIREVLFPELAGTIQMVDPKSIRPTERLAKMTAHIGKTIQARRKASGMTQITLAKAAGIPQSHVSRLESGLHSPSHKTLERIAKALGATVGELNPAY